ncbi:MAG: fimbrillin family protein [Bacteroidales bacterium]|jgi:hypothetical protein|nr:fimbrillin family protein [Bacteroidales bacterium]
MKLEILFNSPGNLTAGRIPPFTTLKRHVKHPANLFIMFITVMVQMFFACTQEDDPATKPGDELQVSVTAAGYASVDPGAPETRATDVDYATSPASGDRIGITVLNSSNAILYDNIPYTFNGATWAPSDAGNKAYIPSGTAVWLVYYPYSPDMNGKKTEADIFNAFTVPADQGDQEKYTASDLMIWSGGLSVGNTLNVTLAHRLALVEVNLSAGTGNASVQAGASGVILPWNISGTTWRCLVKPAAGATVSGKYSYHLTDYAWQANVTLEAGKYTKVDAANGNIDTHSSIEGYTGDIGMLYTDNTSVTIPASDFNWLQLGKTVKSITLNGKTHLIGRTVDPGNPIKLKFDASSGDLQFRGETGDGFIPIGSYAEFQKIYGLDNRTNKYRQEADLDLMNEEWTPIAVKHETLNVNWDFYGEFDGAGKKISNLKIDESSNDMGLFRSNMGTIRNVHIVSGTITVGSYSGGISGWNQVGSYIISCSNKATVSGKGQYIGGIVGTNRGTVTACYNTGAVSGGSYVGGVVGYNLSGTVTACYNTGAVSGGSSVVGSNGGTVTACYWKSGTVTNNNGIGTEFNPYFNPNGTNAAWDTGTGEDYGWWKAGTTNGSQLPQLWYE